jgi:hypothetical protein
VGKLLFEENVLWNVFVWNYVYQRRKDGPSDFYSISEAAFGKGQYCPSSTHFGILMA